MMLRKAIEFGLYPWFPAYGYAYIHPANRRDFEALSPHGKVFEKSVKMKSGRWCSTLKNNTR